MAIFLAAAVFGFYLLSTWYVVGDQAQEPETFQSNSTDSDRDSRLVVLAASIGALVVAFPLFWARGWHPALLVLGFFLGMVINRSKLRGFTGLRPPRRGNSGEHCGLLLAAIAAVALGLASWSELPPGIEGDSAEIGLSAIAVWDGAIGAIGQNQIEFARMLDCVDGLFLAITGPGRFGLMLHPLIAGVLSVIIFFRWLCLLGSRQFAWAGTICYLTSPALQYYSRVAAGATLYLAMLIAVYGVTRCLWRPSVRWAALAGAALGLAQWNYWAARALLVLIPVVVGGVLVAHGWRWMRSILVALVVPLAVVMSPLFIVAGQEDATQLSWMLVPTRYAPSTSVVSIEGVWEQLKVAFELWFNPSISEASFLTMPGTLVLAFPLSVLLLIGLGVAITRVTHPELHVPLAVFAVSIATSILVHSPHNPHRVMLAVPMACAFAALPPALLWEVARRQTSIWRCRIAWMAWLMVGIGAAGGIGYFHTGFWSREKVRREHDDQRWSVVQRIKRDQTDGQVSVRINQWPVAIERFALASRMPPVVMRSELLPPNGSMPWAVHGFDMGFFSSVLMNLLPADSLEVGRDLCGIPHVWSYRSSSATLNQARVTGQQQQSGAVRGALAIREPAFVSIECRDFDFEVLAPPVFASFSDSGTVQAGAGLVWVKVSEGTDGELPEHITVQTEPSSAFSISRDLSLTDLYDVPPYGWLAVLLEIEEDGLPNGNGVVTHLPSLYGYGVGLCDSAPIHRIEIFVTRLQLPPGEHQFLLHGVGNLRDVAIRIGGHSIAPIYRGDSVLLTLNQAELPHGLLAVGIRREYGHDPWLLVRREGRLEIPPPSWFLPPASAELPSQWWSQTGGCRAASQILQKLEVAPTLLQELLDRAEEGDE